MSKSLRLSEKWFRRGLWLVALVFASFLIGLGSTLVGDLPKVERVQQLEDFMDRGALQSARATLKRAEADAQQAQDALEQARLKLQVAEADVATPETFLSNFEPLDRDAARAITDDAITLSRFTEPMRDLLTGFVASSPESK